MYTRRKRANVKNEERKKNNKERKIESNTIKILRLRQSGSEEIKKRKKIIEKYIAKKNYEGITKTKVNRKSYVKSTSVVHPVFKTIYIRKQSVKFFIVFALCIKCMCILFCLVSFDSSFVYVYVCVAVCGSVWLRVAVWGWFFLSCGKFFLLLRVCYRVPCWTHFKSLRTYVV